MPPIKCGIHKAFVRYGGEKLFFNIPPDWRLLTYALFPENSPEADVKELIKTALDNPVESLPLEKLIQPGNKIALIIEDHTRNSPKQDILRVILGRLRNLSVPRDNISIIIALGTHRGLSSDGLKKVYGEDLLKEYSFINHDCNASNLAEIGKLKTGAAVKINRKVYEAGFRIGIGSIFPHPINGYGGGGKILFPGVANYEAILEHHLKHCFRKGSQLGRMKGNPFYEEILLQAKAGRLDFIINSVLDHNDCLYSVVAGSPFEAHEKGVRECERINSMPFSGKADITIISAFPYTEGPQSMKPLAAASMITRSGGVIILAARCSSSIPDNYLDACEAFRQKNRGCITTSLFQLFDTKMRVIKEGAPELNMSAAQALMAQEEFSVIFVSDDIPERDIEKLGFIYAKDMESAIEKASKLVSNPGVHIVPSGGVILPVLGHDSLTH